MGQPFTQWGLAGKIEDARQPFLGFAGTALSFASYAFKNPLAQ
jgi:hypothetical protein